MARRSKSASQQMVESLKDSLTEYFRENIFNDYDYEDMTGSELFEALVETFQELENGLKEELKPIQYVLNKLDPEDSGSQVLNG
jgi:lipoate-protein ligase A